eukprot:g32384.t1
MDRYGSGIVSAQVLVISAEVTKRCPKAVPTSENGIEYFGAQSFFFLGHWRNVVLEETVLTKDQLTSQAKAWEMAQVPALVAGSVDLVICSSVLKFIPDLTTALVALKALLKPNTGLLLQTDWPGNTDSYTDGFNPELANRWYSTADLKLVSAETITFTLRGEEREVFLGIGQPLHD